MEEVHFISALSLYQNPNFNIHNDSLQKYNVDATINQTKYNENIEFFEDYEYVGREEFIEIDDFIEKDEFIERDEFEECDEFIEFDEFEEEDSNKVISAKVNK